MFDIGWAELLVIGSLALIVVGPKDLPRMLRTLGQYAGKARSMAREFQRSMEDAAREADISPELLNVKKGMSDYSRKLGLDQKSMDEAWRKAESKKAVEEHDAAAEAEDAAADLEAAKARMEQAQARAREAAEERKALEARRSAENAAADDAGKAAESRAAAAEAARAQAAASSGKGA